MADQTRPIVGASGWNKPLRPAALRAPSFLRPQAFTEALPAGLTTIACLALLLPIFLIDLLTPRDITVSLLSILPVFAAAWFTPARNASLVAAGAIAIQALLGATHQLHWITVLANSVGIATISWIGHTAAVNSFEARQSRERQLALLLDAARALSAAPELNDVLATLVGATATFISHGDLGQSARATIWAVQGETLRVLREHDDRGFRMRGSFQAAEPVRKLIESRRVGTLKTAELAPDMREVYQAAGVEGCACAPVVVANEPFALITAASRDNEAFSSSELRLLEGLADLGSVAIANAQRLEYERTRTRVFQILHNVAAQFASSADPGELARLVVDQARALADADAAVLALKEGKLAALRVVADSPATVGLILPGDMGVVGQALTDKRPVVKVRDELAAEDPVARLTAGLQSVAAIPVVANGRPLGILLVASETSVFTDEQAHFLLMLASQLGASLQEVSLRANLVESDRRFRSLYAALGCGIVVSDGKGNVQDVNWAATDILGLSADAIKNRPPFGPSWEILLPDGTQLPTALRPPVAVVDFQRPIRNLVATVTRPDGRPVLLRIDSTAIEQQGRTEWVVTTFFELTPAKPAPRRRARS